ncbi:MAG: phosphoheptose isomerase [Magnetovibrio sp.]|nr:phosphoheptose isomerase [Magnetovibrio sp.]|tara:strand:- start:2964 stop:3548 length:585 start_codon:yes stop_codon:yes gene_type:complete
MTLNLDTYIDDEINSHEDTLNNLRKCISKPLTILLRASIKAISSGGKIVFFGNGGSAADAQHLATELTVRYINDRSPIPAIALSTDTSSLTAISNDFGFEDVFARQVDALVKKEDVVIGISTSGNSENIVRALNRAKKKGAVVAGFSGCGGGRMLGLANPLLIVPSKQTARIQEMHILIGHILCGALEQELGLL